MTMEKIRNRYLVQGSWLTELPTMEKPVGKGHPSFPGSWEKFLADKDKYAQHLYSLPKICKIDPPGLKDGAIVEEGVDFQYKRGKQLHTTDQQQWQEMSVSEKDEYFEKVAIPLHREQGEDIIEIANKMFKDGKPLSLSQMELLNIALSKSQSDKPTSLTSTPAGKEDAKVVRDSQYWFQRFHTATNKNVGISEIALIEEMMTHYLDALTNAHPSPQSEQAGESKLSDFAKLKWEIGQIFNKKIKLSEGGNIEGNPAVHAIAEYVAALWQAASQGKGVGEDAASSGKDVTDESLFIGKDWEKKYEEWRSGFSWPNTDKVIDWIRENIITPMKSQIAGYRFITKKLTERRDELIAAQSKGIGITKEQVIDIFNYGSSFRSGGVDEEYNGSLRRLTYDQCIDFLLNKYITPAPDTVQGQEECEHECMVKFVCKKCGAPVGDHDVSKYYNDLNSQ